MNHRIMVVEDDPSHRETLLRHLTRSGYDVTVVEDAERALASFARVDPEVVITDVRMPGMSGFELLRKLQEVASGAQVILITAYDDMQSAIDAMKDGAYDYLVKPLDLDELDEVVEQIFEQRRAIKAAGGQDTSTDAPALAGRLIGRDHQMVAIYKTIGKVAQTRTPILIRGETGTGKELIARTIHENSPTAGEPFISVNCAALPENLLESELFGHVKGSFTGAVADRRGRFELAGHGTIFLDEIGDTTPSFQTKLLRVLQEREFYPVGGEEPRRTEARVLAATHRPMESMVESGEFRKDLYFRLRVVEIVVPPLRHRRADIPALVRSVVERVSRECGRSVPLIPDAVMGALVGQDWPGNVRELENALTRAVVMAQGNALTTENLGLGASAEAGSGNGASAGPGGKPTLADLEKAYVQQVLVETGGHKANTARILGVSRNRLDRIIERYELTVDTSAG
jgi:DNA-binding NtrC family response regulator